MTKPREKNREELQAEIEDGKKKIRQFENREKMLRQKLSKEERRTRSHRLIVRGAVFESIVPEAKDMTDEEAAALLRLVREYCSSQFVSRGMCVDFAIHDTDSGPPIVILCLPCDPLTSAAHGRRNPKRNMTLIKTASVSACQAADTKPTRLTSQAGTTRTTPSCGARHGLTIPTTFWRGTEARSVSTTVATPREELTRYPPSTWAWRLARWRRKVSPPRKAN